MGVCGNVCCVVAVVKIVFFSSLTSFRHEWCACDGCEVKQPLHSPFIFEYINDGKIAIMTWYLAFSNESVTLVISLSDFFLKSFVYLRNS